MKKFILLAIIALTMNVLAFAQTKTAASSAKKEMTVKEYFLAIPNDILKADAKKRTAWIESESTEDGHISFNIPVKEL
ncbi:MAG: hypothetical protein MUC29_14495, partial [Pyrinomonadaceae bacterium]|nr:hypothetical protein [Pyrinomonadaceae bacterium]